MGSIFDKQQETKKVKEQEPLLTKEELVFLLLLIKDSQFEGKDVQTVYTTAMKLQEVLNKMEK